MGKSKENDVLELFFNEPSRHWHFKDIKERVLLPDNKISRWLKIFQTENIICKIKEKNKMPYYISNYNDINYKNRKKLYMLTYLYKTNFLNHLMGLKNAKTVILFGSVSRSDWYKDSDIDLFIYGKDNGFEKAKFENIFKREIQIFNCKNTKELNKLSDGLLKNIIKGDLIKGNLDFLEVKANA